MSMRLFLNATNVHQGGGKSLLWSIIEALPNLGLTVLLLDSRLTLPKSIPENTQIKKVPPSILQRFRAEKWLAQNVKAQDILLCFGNLPPLFKLHAHTIVFVQNRYLIDDVKLIGFPFKIKLRLAIERLWLSTRLRNADEFVVQTPMMKKLLEIKTQGEVKVRILPFVAEQKGCWKNVLQPKRPKKNNFDFVYVSSGEPHKNHRRLIEAWCLLAEENLFPSLCVTLDEDRFVGLCRDIEVMCQRHGLKVTNAGKLSHQDILEIYEKVGASIFPSTLESFGLPLIEAQQAGLPVLASELDFVRDVINPVQTFDPKSAISIARAVKRFMGKETYTLPLLDANGFIECLINSGGKL